MVFVAIADGSTYELTECDYTSATTCVVPVSVLRENKYDLQWGDTIYASVSAQNAVGDSARSATGQSEPVYTIPSEPTIHDDIKVTSAVSVGLKWDVSISDGGTPIIDYAVW